MAFRDGIPSHLSGRSRLICLSSTEFSVELMAKRSLQASPEGARLARKIFDRRGWTQEGLATELDLRTRQPIWRFFTCRPIERHIFVELCTILDLNWWEIADHPPESLLGREGPETTASPSPPSSSPNVNHLVEQLRTATAGAGRASVQYGAGTRYQLSCTAR